jgi:hypothetical protein
MKGDLHTIIREYSLDNRRERNHNRKAHIIGETAGLMLSF